MPVGSVGKRRLTSFSNSVVDARLWDIVAKHVKQITGKNTRHCQAISTLGDQNYRKDRERSQTFVTHLSPQEHAQVIRLVRRKCTVKCLLNGAETEALWDTGAQVSIIPSNWVRKFYPGTDVRNIAELLGLGGLDLKTANGTDLPYKGWVELTFSLAEENSQRSLQVPFFSCQRFTWHANCWL